MYSTEKYADDIFEITNTIHIFDNSHGIRGFDCSMDDDDYLSSHEASTIQELKLATI